MPVLQLIRQFLIFLGKPLYLLLKIIFSSFTKIQFKPLKTKRDKRVQVKITKPKVKIHYKKIAKKIFVFYLLHSNFNFPTFSKPVFKIHVGWKFILLPVSLIILGFSVYYFVFKNLPNPTQLTRETPPLTTHIVDRNGIELYKIYGSQNRTLVQLSDIPLSMRQATVAIEDSEFFNHSGFSIKGTIRALWRNLTSGETVEGGSTITQQLVKISLLSPERSLQRKLRELVLAIEVEMKYSKDQILEMYLNRVGFGGTAYGVEEASQTYFGIPAHDLDLAQSALLAGLPASPTSYSPFGAHPELAKQRQKEVLKRMVTAGYITQDQANQASLEELVFRSPSTDIKAPHFVMYVKELLEKKYGPTVAEQGGLTVQTSLDWNIQQIAQQAVTEEVAKVDYLHIGNGAALVTNPSTGEILAMVGSKNYFDLKGDGNVNVVTAQRQPGSSIKPINYALAFSRNFSPSSIIDDSPIVYRTPGSPDYAPVNYDGKFHGKVSLRTALGSSYNIPAVKLLAANGVDNMLALGQKMGITTWNDPSRFGLSLTLGGGEVTMLDLATAYGVFADAGQKTELRPILKITDSQGNVLEQSFTHSSNVLDPRIAFLISDVLSDNSARTPAFGSFSDLYIPNAIVAVKTGTTNNLRDNWTVGYTPNRLTAVWVGNNDNSPMSYVASGVTGASPIWRRIMDEILKTTPSVGFDLPKNVNRVTVCTLTGELPCNGCPTKSDYFLSENTPIHACSEQAVKAILDSKISDGASIQR